MWRSSRAGGVTKHESRPGGLTVGGINTARAGGRAGGWVRSRRVHEDDDEKRSDVWSRHRQLSFYIFHGAASLSYASREYAPVKLYIIIRRVCVPVLHAQIGRKMCPYRERYFFTRARGKGHTYTCSPRDRNYAKTNPVGTSTVRVIIWRANGTWPFQCRFFDI